MPIDVSSVQTFTDAELLILCRNAVANLTISQSTSINGRTVTREDLPSIRETIEWLETRINNAASGTEGGNVAYAKFNDPV